MPEVPDAELAAEQRVLDAAYARLDDMRRSAVRVADAYSEVRRGGTHQARLERDIAFSTTQRRLAALDIGDAPLCFGRLDLEPEPAEPAATVDGAGPAGGAEPGRYYIGRLSVDDEDHRPLVVDWRAPVAEPFYRATAIQPMGVVRRRHFITRGGRHLVGLDDEVFDADAGEDAGLTIVGEGALFAALERERTGRMHDIVATIQAEQDEAIRSDLDGVLVVAGGPGTGKTAVALHRAAYLLYTYRRRLSGDGVLLVGPNAVFLRYIDQVLPALGEDEAQLTTIRALKPGLRWDRTDAPAVARVKGDARMATVIARAVGDRERGLPRDIVVPIDGVRIRITRRDSRGVVERARRRHGSHNARRQFALGLLLDHLVGRYRRALVRAYRDELAGDDAATGRLALDDGDSMPDPTVAGALSRGEPPPEDWERELRARLRQRPEVREAIERMWPVLSGAELVHDLFSFTALIRSAADGVLERDEQAGLHRPRSRSVADVPWTDSDVALVDEADALLGPVEAARPRRARRRGPSAESVDTARRVVEGMGLGGYTTAETLARRFADSGASNGNTGVDEPRTFGHVLVDEAQDLTPMEWRMLARRCPSRSMTLVGDFGQSSRAGAAGSWDEIVRIVSRPGRARVVTLDVNYRTPAELMTLANRVLAVASPGIAPPRAVRSTGTHPRFVAVDRAQPGALADGAAAVARDAVSRGGTTAVVAPRDVHAAVTAALADVGAVADRADAIDAPVAVLDAADAKGLEFDHVIVVEPARLVTPDPAGLRLLYVTLTRATRDLAVVHADPLPEALETAPVG